MRMGMMGAALTCLLGVTNLGATPPPLPAEHLTTEKLGPPGHHWAFVFDEAFFNETDARVDLYDADAYRTLGQIDAGFNSAFNLSPDASTTVVSTTYFSRGGHGTRTDLVEFVDNSTLSVTGEIVLPNKRAEAPPTNFNVAYSSDGHFVYVAYLTPASSFGVLDPVKKAVLSEIDTAGCVLVIPQGPNRVSSLCESGRLLSVTLDAQGHEASRSLSDPFFDPDKDPIFVQGVPSADGFVFVSFLGQVHEIDTSGATPVFKAPWSLLTAAERDKEHWRPGGQAPLALHRTLNRLYVVMHRGGEGSHKEPGSEVWVFDTHSHQRVARWSMSGNKLDSTLAVQVTQDAQPLALLASEKSDVAVLDALTGRVRHVEKHLGQSAWFFLTP